MMMDDLRNTLVLLSAAEWVHIRSLRGAVKTGLPCHSHKGKYYYWSWGTQPSPKLMRRISASCPLAAADKFLAMFERGSDDKYLRPHPLEKTK